MALLDILVYPDPRLRERAEPVAQVDDGLRRLVDDMLETMYEASGIGLASVQVGDPRRVVVIDVSEERSQPQVLINPEILDARGEATGEEGCLSIPGYYDDVTRAAAVTYRALDYHGEPVEGEAEGTLAVCIQHEIDHLEGRLFIDYLSELKRKRVRKRMEKRERHAAAAG
ncbi:peptide deformylase [Halorhodospira neutriphila]|uniref:Peptide deformylase n=1 Tax=Halorhodospira neutriphila TaxID=168379 RepID=A0ABS1E9K3_9GAMM|nr:peptide deformylase [Halorhodospira neutriphila]MBK1727657.1 peptide deformylase [Halorhodospira neutriphila]